MTDRPDFYDRDYSGGDEYPSYRSYPYSGGGSPATSVPGDDGATTGAQRVLVSEEPMSWRQRAMQRRKNMPWWQEVPLLLIVALCVAVLVRTFLVQAFFIPSGSMEDTLQVGDRVVVDKMIYHFKSPERGDIVVFSGTDSWTPEYTPDTDAGFFTKVGRALGDLVGISQPGEKDFVKRVVGLPGDTVACCDVNGRVTVNGTALDEPYVTGNSPVDTDPSRNRCASRRFEPVTVGQGQLFVMGDHRLVSQDSRCQGEVPIDHIIGEAKMIIWPVSHLTWLSRPSTFDEVPRPLGMGGSGTAHIDGVPTGTPAGPPVLPGSLAAGAAALVAVLPGRAHLIGRRRGPGGRGEDVGSGGD